MKSVLLCGCGNIGFRHLQAMLGMPAPAAITIVEPNEGAHARIAALFEPAEAKGFRFDLCGAVPTARQRFDLVVIATPADRRRIAFDSIVANHDVGVMILEKVLFQTQADLDEVAQILSARGISAYVNCPRRYFPGYRDLRDEAAMTLPLHVTIRGAGYALASNGIHFLDLAEYLNDAALVSLESGLRSGSVEAKRSGCVEVFGQLCGTLSNGATVAIVCDDTEPMAFDIMLEGSGFSAKINEITREVTIGARAPATFASHFVSEIWEIYHDALTTGRCGLTPYADSARQHRLFLTALMDHLGLDAASTCPIS